MYNNFNIHKHKRKWGRGFKIASDFIFSSSKNTAQRDFDWHKRKRNPFWQEKGERDWKKIIELSILGIAILSMIIISVFSHFFYIKTINIAGLQRISETEIKEATLGVINYKRLFIFPGQNYFIVDLDEVRDILKEKFPIESIIISKTFPNNLNIVVEEKISTLIYDNGINYSYIGTDGHIVEILRKVGDDEWQTETKITTSTNETGEIITKTDVIKLAHIPSVRNIVNEMGDYPIVYDIRNRDTNLNDQVLNENNVAGIISWFNLLTKRTDIAFGYVVLENDLGDGIIKTREGWDIKVKLNKEIDKQFEELQYTLKNKIKRNNLQYIDLRYLGKIYWQ
ncbi:MAG: FtsQ-type POTRA domain-containing protein [Candidatus Magasanikiibacteriota bacterium]